MCILTSYGCCVKLKAGQNTFLAVSVVFLNFSSFFRFRQKTKFGMPLPYPMLPYSVLTNITDIVGMPLPYSVPQTDVNYVVGIL